MTLVSFVSVIVGSFRMYDSNIRANKKTGCKKHLFQPLAVQILTTRSIN